MESYKYDISNVSVIQVKNLAKGIVLEWDDIASLALGGIGILVSLAGFTVAFLQIRKTRKATEAVTEATEKSQAILTKNVMLADLSTCIGIIETAKLFLNSQKFDAALVKLKELQGKVIQLRAFENHLSHQEYLQEIIGQVAVMNIIWKDRYMIQSIALTL